MINRQWFNSKNFNPANYIVSNVLMYLRAMYEFNSQLGFEVWNEQSQEQSSNLPNLVIADKQTWETTHRGHLPSIILQRQMVTFGGGIQDGGGSRVVQAGAMLETSVMEIVTVPMVLSCIARQDLEAEALAFLTGQFLWDDKRWTKAFGMFGMTSPRISEVQIYNPSENSFVCHVSTSLSMTKNYTMHTLPHDVLEQLVININGKSTNLNIQS